jgi:hypothetical protein
VADANFYYSPDLLSLTGPSKSATLSSTQFAITENAFPANNAQISYRGLQVNDNSGNTMNVIATGLGFPMGAGTTGQIVDVYGSPGAAFQVLTAGPTSASVQWGNSVPCGLAVIPSSELDFSTYYIPTPPAAILDQHAVVSALLYIADGGTTNRILRATPYLGSNSLWYIEVEFTSGVGTAGTTIAWAIHAPTSTPVDISGNAP